jgi:hypothetical protein
VTGFVVILAALQFAVPVRCYQSTDAWNAQAAAVNASRALAYYLPSQNIALSPFVCREVRRPTAFGANVLAHELAHLWQDEQGRAFDEEEADRIAARTDGALLRRLARLFGRRPAMTPTPDAPVRLAP